MSIEVYLKEIRGAAIDKAVEDLAKEGATGSTERATRHSFSVKVQSLSAIGATIKIDALYKRVQRLRQQQKQCELAGSRHPLIVDTSTPASEVSSLVSPSVTNEV